MFIKWLSLIKPLLIFQDKFKMKQNIKTISFAILILSLGLVLSACGKNQETGEQEIGIEETGRQEGSLSAETEMIQEEEIIEEEMIQELSANDWRAYENEYFNIRFKYHQSWYFQRDKINEGDYIAVYGFAPSAEELNDKDYAIQLFILNSADSLSEDFSYSKEKEQGNKKYILVSNKKEYTKILNLMFENLEFIN